MVGLAAGSLNRRVEIQAPARISNNQGGFTKGWATERTVSAEMIPLRGGEAMAHNLVRGTQLWKVTIRWRAGITREHRLLYQDRPLNIRSCEDPDGLREQLIMTCEEGVKN